MKGASLEMAVHFETGRAGRLKLRMGAAPAAPVLPAGRIQRISRLMALALKFERLLREGAAKDYIDLARLGGVTLARMSQIMGMLNLAPDIQESILFLPLVEKGRDPLCDRVVWAITREANWERQRGRWATVA